MLGGERLCAGITAGSLVAAAGLCVALVPRLRPARCGRWRWPSRRSRRAAPPGPGRRARPRAADARLVRGSGPMSPVPARATPPSERPPRATARRTRRPGTRCSRRAPRRTRISRGHVMEAHRAAGLLPKALRFVTVRRGDGSTALLPYTLSHDLTGLGGRVARPFLSPFMTASAPLVADGPDRDRRRRGPGGRAGDRLGRPGLALAAPADRGGPVPEMLAAMRARGLGDRHGGGVRAPGRGPPRRSRRLPGGASEPVAVQGSAPPRPPARGGRRGRPRMRHRRRGSRTRLVAAFLDLERAGWKGSAGTAMACRPETARSPVPCSRTPPARWAPGRTR